MNLFQRLRVWLRFALGFSSREINGFLGMLIITSVCLFLPFWLYSTDDHDKPSFSADHVLLDSLLRSMEERNQAAVVYKINRQAVRDTTLRPRPFDPNTIEEEDMIRMGIPAFLAGRIERFRAKGGRFRQPEDLADIYDFPPSLYRQLAPYIRIQADQPRPAATPKAPKAAPRIELNQADTTALIALRGIGAATAGRIVRYRARLGGFADMHQLREVYGIRPDALEALAERAYVDPSLIEKIPVNTSDVERLKAHPYIGGYKMAKIIIRYREEHGPYQHLQDLAKVQVLADSTLQKLAPYLSFESPAK